MDWDILYKLCGSVNKCSKGFVFSGKIWWQFFSCNKACSKYHTRSTTTLKYTLTQRLVSFIYDVHRDYMKGKLKAYSTNLEFQIQFQIFRLTWRVSHETLLNQWMKRLSQRWDASTTYSHIRKCYERQCFTVFAVFIDPVLLSVVNFRLFVVWDKPKNIGWVYFSSKRPINNFIVFSVQLIFGIALKCMRCLSR